MEGTGISFSDIVSAEGEEREGHIRDLVSRLTLDEKVEQMSGDTPLTGLLEMARRYNARPYPSGENRRLGIPSIRFTDGPHGIAVNNSTCFPVSMARGATWDAELEERVGDVMGVEARAQGANYFGGVCINLLRHPGWGRAQETFGEDPYHLGVMGTAMIKGLQKHVMACAKHFACNSIENARFRVDVRVDERTLREIYLPHFRRCVEEGVASIMAAYNRVNGRFCGHNSRLLREILKRDWNFQGFVISDFLVGIRSAKAAKAGLDIEMPIRMHYIRRLKKMVMSERVAEQDLDEAVTRVLRQKARFAEIGDPKGYDRSQVACRDHTDLALEVARKSIVLLKNDSSALPLERDKIKKIAVAGRLADFPNLGDRGSSRVYPPYTITPLAGIMDRAGDSLKVVYESGKDMAAARKAARESDAVVVVAGLTYKDEGEFMFIQGGDREDLDLPAAQQELIKAMAEENQRCIVVLEGGSAITIESWRDEVSAIIMAWYPGMEGGRAIADVIFGDVNPSGKLPITFPKSTHQLPYFNKRALKIDYGYWHGYRLFDSNDLESAFPFGFGVSYTEYKYSNLRLSEKSIPKSGKIEVMVDVKNTGKIPGEEIVQIYVGYNGSRVERPVKDLKGFAKIQLEPGQTKTVSLQINPRDLAFYNIDKKEWEIEEIEYIVYAGPSSKPDHLLSTSFNISGL
jgi:beta-glucosidase